MSDAHAAAAHPPGLAHHFESYEQQKESSFLGMWLFLVQEVMFFGGLFCVYVTYRSLFGDAFAAASRELNVLIGAVNTTVLLFSSFTMVIAVNAAKKGDRKWIVYGLLLTILFFVDKNKIGMTGYTSRAKGTMERSPKGLRFTSMEVVIDATLASDEDVAKMEDAVRRAEGACPVSQATHTVSRGRHRRGFIVQSPAFS